VGEGPGAEASDARWLRHAVHVRTHLSRKVERPINRAACESRTVVVIECRRFELPTLMLAELNVRVKPYPPRMIRSISSTERGALSDRFS
jgi:hypothetical protein